MTTRIHLLFAHIGKKTAAAFFTCLIATSLFAAFPAQKAEAQIFGGLFGRGDIVHDPINSVFQRLSASVGDSLALKEFQLDAIAYRIAQGLISEIIQTTIDWVNSGFQGSPAYVENIKEYLLGELDAIAGEFIQGSALSFLCQPFQFNVRLAIQTAYQESRDFERASQCTLTGAVANIQNFLGGNFADGGWGRWFELVHEPQNNVHGAYALAAIELSARLGEEEINRRAELNWGDGFLSMKDENGRIVTPGAVIADRVNSVLGLGEQSLVQADEINELISALMNQLATQVLSGFRGLAGLSQGFNGQASFTAQLGDPASNVPMGSSGGTTSGGGTTGTGTTSGTGSGTESSVFAQFITYEMQYADLHRPLVARLTTLETRASAEASCSAMASPLASVQSLRASMQQALTSAETGVSTLQALDLRYRNATTQQERVAVLQEFEALRASGSVHTVNAITLRQYEIDSTIIPQIESLEERVDDALDDC